MPADPPLRPDASTPSAKPAVDEAAGQARGVTPVVATEPARADRPTRRTADGRTSAAAMLSLADVAAVLAVSRRHVLRLVDAGRMPAPLRIGSCLRWRRSDVEAWIAAGCPDLRDAR